MDETSTSAKHAGRAAADRGAGAGEATEAGRVAGARGAWFGGAWIGGSWTEEDEVGRASARAVRVLLDELPEAAATVAGLAEDFDDGLSAHSVFAEIAAVASQILERAPTDMQDEELLERIFAAVEAVAATPGADVVTTVAYGFLDELGPGAYDRALPYCGPATERLALLLEQDALEEEGGDEDEVEDEDEDDGTVAGRGAP